MAQAFDEMKRNFEAAALIAESPDFMTYEQAMALIDKKRESGREI